MIVSIIGWLILIYVGFVILFYILMITSAYRTLSKRKMLDDYMLEEDFKVNMFTKPVSILVPAYNEAVGIVESLHSLINLRYPESEIIVIDDGSTDDTADILIKKIGRAHV